jgi:hypothetical protein
MTLVECGEVYVVREVRVIILRKTVDEAAKKMAEKQGLMRKFVTFYCDYTREPRT